MVSIIKNQLLKHLSRFTKNLSADKINLSTFKGEGELTNLELNEIVLTDLLELPSWLKLTKGWCNRVTFRIQWTKLKSVPIILSLDEVNIIVETCEELRSPSAQAGLSSYAAVPGKYSFIHKVIDGITVTVNIVNVMFNSPAFTASVQISRIVVESKTPRFTKSDLRMTRLKDPQKGQLLIFKELEWQTVRIEAKSTKDKNLTPLRLLTNQARCRITIKKRLSDCFVMGSRLVVILDDLLWVLTDSQLKAALHFLDSLAGLVQRATLVTRKAKAARKLEELPEYRAQLDQQARQKNGISTISKMFAAHDVVETSYHFLSRQIILHLCDDSGSGRSNHPNLKDGGALQIELKRFQVDYYPYHLAKSSRKHWPCYREEHVPHTGWQEQALSSFRTRFMDLIQRNKTVHAPLTRANKGGIQLPTVVEWITDEELKKTNQIKSYVLEQFMKLMTTCVIIKIEDFTIYKVTTSGKKSLKEFITGDRCRMSLPKETSIIHAEFIYFYYPDDIPFPLPPPKFYVQINPVDIFFDVDSCLWFNAFALNLYHSLFASKQVDQKSSNLTYVDVKIEAILPRIILESSVDYPNQRDRPKSLVFQVTRATITNIRSLEQSSRADLAKCVDSFHMGSLFFGSEFPSHPNDFYIVTQKFLDHISATDNIRELPTELNVSTLNVLFEQLSRELLWTEAKDVWCVNLEPIWADFLGTRAVGVNKAIPFLDVVPLTVWLHTNMDPNSTIKLNKSSTGSPKNADIHALAHVSNLVSIQINHYQYLFLLRLSEEIAELATFLSLDSSRIMKVENTGSLVFGALIPQLEVTFVMPSQCPGKESSGGDVESFVPDSSSIADDVLVGSTATVWQNSTLSISQVEPLKAVSEGFSVSYVEPLRARSEGFSVSYEEPFSISQVEPSRAMAEGSISFDPVLNTDIKPHGKNTSQTFSNINITNNFNVGLSSMKKGFSNIMTSLDSALKSSPDDISDTSSIKSDASSDSENYIMVQIGADGIDKNAETLDESFFVAEFEFESRAPVEVASEVIEEDSTITSNSDHSLISSCKRKDLISISTFKLNKVEFLQQSTGYSSSVKVQVGNIINEDCCSIPWDEFQSKFSSRSRAWTDSTSNSSTITRIKLRLDHELSIPSSRSLSQMDFNDKHRLKKLFKDTLSIKVDDLDIELPMSTVTGLADLAEDEIITNPIPLQIFLENIQLHLIEDRPPVNITSPGTVPLHLNITRLYIARSEDGVFNIQPQTSTVSASSSVSSLHENNVTKQLRVDNEELKRRLLAFERVSEENRALRRSKEETDVLRTCLASSQDEVARLLEEKRKLLNDIKELQAQLSSERGRQWNSKR